MPWRRQDEPTTVEKICGGLSYFTLGIVGMIYVLFFVKNGAQSPLFRFHFIQSILLGILAMLVGMCVTPLLSIILQLVAAVAPGAAAPFAGAVSVGAIVVSGAFNLLLVYGAIMSFLGKFAEVPVISNIVRQNAMR